MQQARASVQTLERAPTKKQGHGGAEHKYKLNLVLLESTAISVLAEGYVNLGDAQERYSSPVYLH